MRKLPPKYDDMIDNMIYRIVPFLSNLMGSFTPNMITLLSFIFGLISVRSLYFNYFIKAMIFYSLSYIFDCIDGYHARRKNMTSKFGDYFDHISDIFVFILLFLVLYIKISKNSYCYHIIVLTFINIILMSFHFTLQECYYGKDTSPFLNFFNLKIKNPEKYLIITRYFGSGSFNLYIVGLIFFLSFNII